MFALTEKPNDDYIHVIEMRAYVEVMSRLEVANGLLFEIFRNMKPRDCVTDWYDRAKEYLDKRTS